MREIIFRWKDEKTDEIKLPGNDTAYTADKLAKQNAIEAWNRRTNNGKVR